MNGERGRGGGGGVEKESEELKREERGRMGREHVKFSGINLAQLLEVDCIRSFTDPVLSVRTT